MLIILLLDWYTFWCFPRPVAICQAFAELVSYQNEATVTNVDSLWSTFGAPENDFAIVWPRGLSTVNYCKQNRKAPHNQIKRPDVALTLAHWWFSRPISVLLAVSHLVSYQLEAFIAEVECLISWLESSVLYETIVKSKLRAQPHWFWKKKV